VGAEEWSVEDVGEDVVTGDFGQLGFFYVEVCGSP
jgi:hypothetical protein